MSHIQSTLEVSTCQSNLWQTWRIWDRAPHFTQQALAETLDGGQAFRWQSHPNYYEGRWGEHVVRVRLTEGHMHFSIPTGVDPATTTQALQQYFATNINFSELTDQLPWRSDSVLATAINPFQGLRILRQPFSETLFGFLCSSTKKIPQIKAICESVAHDLGPRLPDGSYGLPDWIAIAEAGENRLRAAKLGYRARYIHQTACILAEQPGWLTATENAPTAEARERLLSLPGVGRKIADCVLLFGAGRLEAFPIDTWVEKILIRAYSLENWKLPHLQEFARVHFGASAGYAQQYLFAAARSGYIAKAPPKK